MKLPLHDGITDADTDKFIKQVSRLTLSQVVERVTVTERLSGLDGQDARLRKYTVLLGFYPPDEYRSEYGITSEMLHESLVFNFAGKLKREIQVDMRDAAKTAAQDLQIGVGLKVRGNDLAEDADGDRGRKGQDDELDDDDGDAYQAKRQAQARQHEYEEDDADSGVADLEDFVERQLEEHDADGELLANGDPDEAMEVDATEKAEAEAKADVLSETFKAANKYATSFSFDLHGGHSAQFDLEVSHYFRMLLSSSFRQVPQSCCWWISLSGHVGLLSSMRCRV